MQKKVGAPLGNQNARKHGFYSRIHNKVDRRNFEDAALIEGIDQEITFLRSKILNLVETDPDNVRLFSQMASILARLLRTRRYLAGSQEDLLNRIIQSSSEPIDLPDVASL